ncbi:dnaj chaperone-like protein [Strigomonas culicis]|uniref:Dnaj chaperone-like protein n=1 Tax=Strigomonas culicis TaxID=28005 RepID=S9W2A8_9TRYP|nr:dnaj chaperone-like protein [Strigomonas culicis]|eukprot:EPY29955.1 dnaj chaperone-like protein [Strigomonas culicis]
MAPTIFSVDTSLYSKQLGSLSSLFLLSAAASSSDNLLFFFFLVVGAHVLLTRSKKKTHMVDYYAALEVDRNASEEAIKRSYRRLALRYHPDKAGPDGTAKFKEISIAYQVLSDPQKKDVYDQYGEAGLEAMDNPLHNVVPLKAIQCVMIVTLSLLLLITIMILLFFAFLCAYVDGRLSENWSYVKVFAPLFIIDIVVGLITLVLMIMTPCILRGLDRVRFWFACLAVLCVLVLTIVTPVAKDEKDRRAADGRTDYVQWRVWLTPGYLLSCFVLLAVGIFAPTTAQLRELRAYGRPHFARYRPVSFALRMLAAACLPTFFALVACRADEVITTNYFVVIALPAFVAAGCLLVDFTATRVLAKVRTPVDDEAGNAPPGDTSNAGETYAHTSERAAGEDGHGEEEGNGFSTPENLNSTPPQSCQGQADAPHSTAGSATGATPTSTFAEDSLCLIVARAVVLLLVMSLLLATIVMVAVRLNHHAAHGTYAGVMPLGHALIPLYLLIGVLVCVALFGLLFFCCAGPVLVAPLQSDAGEEEAHPMAPADAAAAARPRRQDHAPEPTHADEAVPVLLLPDKPVESESLRREQLDRLD